MMQSMHGCTAGFEGDLAPAAIFVAPLLADAALDVLIAGIEQRVAWHAEQKASIEARHAQMVTLNAWVYHKAAAESFGEALAKFVAIRAHKLSETAGREGPAVSDTPGADA